MERSYPDASSDDAEASSATSPSEQRVPPEVPQISGITQVTLITSRITTDLENRQVSRVSTDDLIPPLFFELGNVLTSMDIDYDKWIRLLEAQLGFDKHREYIKAVAIDGSHWVIREARDMQINILSAARNGKDRVLFFIHPM